MTDTELLSKQNRDNLLWEWQQAKTKLDEAKKLEKQLKEAVLGGIFPNLKVGTTNEELDNGYVCKAVMTESYKLTGTNDEVNDVEDKLGDDISELLIQWKPTIVKGVYLGLSDVNKSLVNTVLTIKENAPTLNIVQPKA